MSLELNNISAASINMNDPEGFKLVFNSYYPSLCAFADRFLQDAEQSKDIVSDIFFKLWNKEAVLRKDLNIKSYLYTTVRNACIDFLRKEKREHEQFMSLANDENFFNEVLKAEVLQEIYSEINSLPDQCRIIFKKIYIDGLTYGEIAKQMDLAESTVRNQKARAISLIKRKLFPDSLFTVAAVSAGVAWLTMMILLLIYIIN